MEAGSSTMVIAAKLLVLNPEKRGKRSILIISLRLGGNVCAADIENNVVDENIVYGCINDPNMPNLEEIVYSDDDEEVSAEADMNNLATNVPVSPIPTTRVHKDHHLNKNHWSINIQHIKQRMTKAWYETLSTTYLKMGFEEALLDMTCFIRKMMHKRFQMSSIGELTFFLGLQVKQKDDGIFIQPDKISWLIILKKFDFVIVKTASTPRETNKALLKMKKLGYGCFLLYRSLFQVTPKVLHIHAVKRIFRYLKGQPKLGLWYPRDSPFDMEAFSDSDYAGASLDRKSTTGGVKGFKIKCLNYGINFMYTDLHVTKELHSYDLSRKHINAN
ncbi:hypothetical protein Tco_0300126 [Tanacetum coccineum]